MKLNDLQKFANLTLGYPVEPLASFTFICIHGNCICVPGLSLEFILDLPATNSSCRVVIVAQHENQVAVSGAVPEETVSAPSPNSSLAVNLL